MKYRTLILLLTLITSQLACVARGCETYITDEWPDSRYTIQSILGDDVVTDKKTGLMWKRSIESTGTSSRYTWQQALATPVTINAIGFAGFSNWRLPNIEELRSIAAINCTVPSINEVVFPSTPSEFFWSSSPSLNLNFALYLSFYSGYDGADSRHSSNRVRLVRSRQ